MSLQSLLFLKSREISEPLKAKPINEILTARLCRAALVDSFNFLPIVVTLYTDY